MSISINNLLSQFRVQLPILTTLPEVVPAGAEFYYNGTKWRGLGAGETGLPEGTPWPVKGYKEKLTIVEFEQTLPNSEYVILNDISEIISISKETGTGEYLISSASSIDGVIVVQTSAISQETGGLSIAIPTITGNTSRTLPVGMTVYDGAGNFVDLDPDGEDVARITLSIKVYPPQP